MGHVQTNANGLGLKPGILESWALESGIQPEEFGILVRLESGIQVPLTNYPDLSPKSTASNPESKTMCACVRMVRTWFSELLKS